MGHALLATHGIKCGLGFRELRSLFMHHLPYLDQCLGVFLHAQVLLRLRTDLGELSLGNLERMLFLLLAPELLRECHSQGACLGCCLVDRSTRLSHADIECREKAFLGLHRCIAGFQGLPGVTATNGGVLQLLECLC